MNLRPVSYPETSATNYEPMTRNIQEERRPHKNLQLISEDILVNLELRQTQEYTEGLVTLH